MSRSDSRMPRIFHQTSKLNLLNFHANARGANVSPPSSDTGTLKAICCTPDLNSLQNDFDSLLLAAGCCRVCSPVSSEIVPDLNYSLGVCFVLLILSGAFDVSSLYNWPHVTSLCRITSIRNVFPCLLFQLFNVCFRFVRCSNN